MNNFAPARMTLINLRTTEEQEVMFNPAELTEKLSVVWALHTVPGLSHQPAQYSHTTNHTYGLELFCIANTLREQRRMEEFRRFILSLCYGSAGAGDIPGGSPPRVLFVWPAMATFTAGINGEVSFTHRRFNALGQSTWYTATLELMEMRDVRLTSEEVRAQGTRRSGI